MNSLIKDSLGLIFLILWSVEVFSKRKNPFSHASLIISADFGLELTGKEKANLGDCVHIGRGQVGLVTSGMLSPRLSKNIALCRIDTKYSKIGTEVEIGKLDGHQKRILAKVVPFPFYDPTKSRVKA